MSLGTFKLHVGRRMPREVRVAEPIHVTRATLGISGLGFLLWGIGYLWLAQTPSGSRGLWILITAGHLLIAFAILNHAVHHRRRFGLLALVLMFLANVGVAAVTLPFTFDPSLLAKHEWSITWIYDMYGAALLIGAAAVLLVCKRKASRLQGLHKSAEDEIHASFFVLTVLAIGLLVWGAACISLSVKPTSEILQLGKALGPALIAVALIVHIEHLALRIGRPSVVLAVVAAVVASVSQFNWGTNEATWDTEITSQGFAYILAAVACVLVGLHKKAWEQLRD